MKRAAVVLSCFVLGISFALVNSQNCGIWQSLSAPRVFGADFGTRCGEYANLSPGSCCTPSAAKRAYNWVLEDDGCGVVFNDCRKFLTDVACAVNCAADLVVTGVNYNTSTFGTGKIVLCRTWGVNVFEACRGYGWCAEHLRMSSDCTFLATAYSGKRSYIVQRTVQDTCQLVEQLTATDFVENILGLVHHTDDDTRFCTNPRSIARVAAAPRSSTAISSGLLLLIAAFVTVSSRYGSL
jgi:hypothetical protein